ncbi:DUF1848 domain-containing protein [Klebsiella pneumoniae]|uniref:Domain of uncharacterized function (DUF1848) n=2 Tax=Klebsiella pneumoniae TaxID=573 RepID=A0A378UD68_KLEPO|nr:DUF1848 domain-containing protein [Klebsiella pneumoniae]MBU9718624.1 DUF1848 domain-containing protein [Klebsiella pneumoniae subsp. ozaenae]MCY0709073.1 DUF1848 domain-containing protein [Klebsiella pneumoniae]STS59979.1 Domain of uncharacterised function (DUF1848) [Klebsiella pneumoniae]STU33311.1 Domain of uncharacterised function (DUF1848) [Klebsiella pneumoniae]STU48725.1 Domain of uncharacterised function (DUF1848) [Klebsiella pneumoniae]
MIISASRRTDIPAFYMKWFLKKLKDESVNIRNPFNKKQEKVISLARDDIDFIVFWTRDARALLKNINELDSYNIPYYVNYTVTGYGREVEVNARELDESIQTIIRLSEKIGKSRVVWRYDPIIISDRINYEWHENNFLRILSETKDYINKIIVSIIDEYKKNKKNLLDIGVLSPTENINEYHMVVKMIAEHCQTRKVLVQSCSEELIPNEIIPAGACIDPSIIYGNMITSRKDHGQRRCCKCYPSTDIGEYNTCFYGCKYCYATSREPKKLT